MPLSGDVRAYNQEEEGKQKYANASMSCEPAVEADREAQANNGNKSMQQLR